jgi:hypothetical protein
MQYDDDIIGDKKIIIDGKHEDTSEGRRKEREWTGR